MEGIIRDFFTVAEAQQIAAQLLDRSKVTCYRLTADEREQLSEEIAEELLTAWRRGHDSAGA